MADLIAASTRFAATRLCLADVRIDRRQIRERAVRVDDLHSKSVAAPELAHRLFWNTLATRNISNAPPHVQIAGRAVPGLAVAAQQPARWRSVWAVVFTCAGALGYLLASSL